MKYIAYDKTDLRVLGFYLESPLDSDYIEITDEKQDELLQRQPTEGSIFLEAIPQEGVETTFVFKFESIYPNGEAPKTKEELMQEQIDTLSLQILAMMGV